MALNQGFFRSHRTRSM